MSADLVRGGGGGALGEADRDEEAEATFSGAGGRNDSSLDLEEPEKETLWPLELRAVSLGRNAGK